MRNLLLLLCLIYSVSVAQNADISILRSINVGRNKGLDPACRFLSNSVTPLSVCIPFSYTAISLLKHDSASFRKSLVVAASMATAAVVSTTLKYSIRRTRPYITYPEIEKAGSGGSPSFPSGHTSAAFSLATAMSLACPKWYVIAPAYVYACGVGYSRMHLGVHYPSDVLAGAIIGAGSSFLCYKVNNWILKRHGRN